MRQPSSVWLQSTSFHPTVWISHQSLQSNHMEELFSILIFLAFSTTLILLTFSHFILGSQDTLFQLFLSVWLVLLFPLQALSSQAAVKFLEGCIKRCLYLLVIAAAAKSHQSCPTLCDPIDGSPPGSPVPGILQARTLEWVAISFSNA